MAVVLALVSAALFGAMAVALRLALLRNPDARLGAFVTASTAFCVALAASVVLGGATPLREVAVFTLIGALAPGISQLTFTLAVREAGAARSSVVVGTAPLVAVVLAVLLLDEPLALPIALGALLIVAGGAALAWERLRPADFRAVGILWAVASTLAFASRDNIVRWLSLDAELPAAQAAAATLFGGALALGLLAVRRGSRRPLPFVPVGLLFGASYVALFEAFYRGRVGVVSPLVATESLFGVGLSALLIGRSELVGRRLVVGAALIVAGAALIGATR